MKQLPWIAAPSISTHWLRHTTLTWVERNFGYAIALAHDRPTTSPRPTAPDIDDRLVTRPSDNPPITPQAWHT